jgi:hypothetical protein
VGWQKDILERDGGDSRASVLIYQAKKAGVSGAALQPQSRIKFVSPLVRERTAASENGVGEDQERDGALGATEE